MHRVISTAGKEEDLKYDATLLILSSHNNVSKEIKFKGVFPTSLSSIEFNTQLENVDYVQADISFGFTNFEIN